MPVIVRSGDGRGEDRVGRRPRRQTMIIMQGTTPLARKFPPPLTAPKKWGGENYRGGKTFGWLFPSLARWGGAGIMKFLWVGVGVKVKIFFACGARLLIVSHPIPVPHTHTCTHRHTQGFFSHQRTVRIAITRTARTETIVPPCKLSSCFLVSSSARVPACA